MLVRTLPTFFILLLLCQTHAISYQIRFDC